MKSRLAVTVRGTVQGVGFRPFVYRLARRHQLAGWVRNSTGPVEIEVEGQETALSRFLAELEAEAPRLARIDEVRAQPLAPCGGDDFAIVASHPRAGDYQPVTPDAATCEDCRRELFDPGDRRHRYPFTNCTNCGPRFTVIEALPYDRPLTTMRGFTMCERCRREYEDPGDRRFHAQPNACWDCGPQLSCQENPLPPPCEGEGGVGGNSLPAGEGQGGEDPLARAVVALRAGRIVALKGLGGYQLACDARSEVAVARLRERKRRPSKPFAVMMEHPVASPEAAAALGSPAHPIVLLGVQPGLAEAIAPGLAESGVMLPYSPLHHLLLHDFGGPLVMTSGNLSEEPICREDPEARERLGGVADVFLAHDRPIAARYDDSVVRVAGGAVRVIRRARGLAPEPLPFPAGPPLAATGAHLKAAFTVARSGHAFVGPHVGDLDDLLTVTAFEEQLARYLDLFGVRPELVACDLHPDYASTRIAERLSLEPVRVQHHHAHVAGVIAEHRLGGPVVGVALDGVGLGTDGTVWGGEVLACEGAGFERLEHLEPVPLPGGDICAREGWRMAAAYGLDEPPAGVDPRRFELVRRLAASGAAPLTSSAGRLFDAVASLLGVSQASSYEGEAAVRLEAIAEAGVAEVIEVELTENRRLFAELAERRRRGEPAPRLAAVFHNSLARAVIRACRRSGLRQAALSGGCFQNRRLLESCLQGLREAGLEAYANRQVPANDGGLSLGQAWVAALTAEGAG